MAELLSNELHLIGYDEIKIYRGHIAEYENGKREPFLAVLLAYSIIFKVELSALVDDRREIFSK